MILIFSFLSLAHKKVFGTGATPSGHPIFNSKSNNSITAVYEKNSYKFDDIANIIKKNNITILDIATEDGDLEDVFVQLTNN